MCSKETKLSITNLKSTFYYIKFCISQLFIDLDHRKYQGQ